MKRPILAVFCFAVCGVVAAGLGDVFDRIVLSRGPWAPVEFIDDFRAELDATTRTVAQRYAALSLVVSKIRARPGDLRAIVADIRADDGLTTAARAQLIGLIREVGLDWIAEGRAAETSAVTAKWDEMTSGILEGGN